MTTVVARGHPSVGGGLTVDTYPEIEQVVVGVGQFRGNMEYITLSAAETAQTAAALIAAGKSITQEDKNG